MREFMNLIESYLKEEGTPMQEPMVLYRSMSIPELVSVAFRGEVSGGGNRFNGFENRKWVFFGDKLSDNLIGQGEDHTRYPSHSLKDDDIHTKFRAAKEEADDYGHMVTFILKKLAKEKQWNVKDDVYDGLARGESFAVSKAMAYAPYDPKLKSALEQTKIAFSVLRKLEDEYAELHQGASRSFRDNTQRWPFSSAVIVTRPITGGTVFSEDSGESNHDGAEYGFYPGDVRLDDIEKVILYKDGKAVQEISPTQILGTLRNAGIDIDQYMA
jgi:hypothetical protein